MREKILTIVNPVSGNGKAGRLWPGFARSFARAGIELNVCFTRGPGDATRIAREGLNHGFRRIMAVGGDGTANEVVNGLLGHDEINLPELIIFSQGSGCDFIKSLGISNQVEDIIDIIKRNRVKYIDLGLVTYVTHTGEKARRYFINIGDIGIGGETTELVNHSSKLLGGLLTYLLGALRVLLTYQNKCIKLVIDDKTILEKRVNSILVANGIFFAGGMPIAPGAKLEDGLFNIIVIGDLGKIEFLTNLIRAYRGTHLTHPEVSFFYGRKIEVSSEERVLIELDGEAVGLLPASFQILPGKLPVCY